MTYNITWTNTTNHLGDLVINMNTTSNGYIAAFFMVAIFVVIFAVFKDYDINKVLTFDFFIMASIGALFWAVELLAILWVIVPLVAMLFFIVLIFFKKDG